VKDRPTHDHEIMKIVNEKCGGSYMPSLGVIYPTLRMLEDGSCDLKDRGWKEVYG